MNVAEFIAKWRRVELTESSAALDATGEKNPALIVGAQHARGALP